jgi:hypothetical protein
LEAAGVAATKMKREITQKLALKTVAAKRKTTIKQRLAMATCSLLASQAHSEAIDNEWKFDSSFASYKESDDRSKNLS